MWQVQYDQQNKFTFSNRMGPWINHGSYTYGTLTTVRVYLAVVRGIYTSKAFVAVTSKVDYKMHITPINFS